MEIIYLDANDIKPLCTNLSLCLGYFDGLHLGHQKVIQEAVLDSIGPVGVVTFSQAPSFISKKHETEMVLMSNRMKARELEKIGVSYLIVLEANEKLIKMTVDQFIIKILSKLRPKCIYCGPDYRFGYLRMGDPTALKKYFKVKVVSEYRINDEKVSSSKIIKYLKNGDLEKTKEALGRNYHLEGTITSGKHLGTEIGFPTANFEFGVPYCLPKNGVYYTRITIDGIDYDSLTNIGTRPTVNKKDDIVLEVHILEFSGDLYGKTAELSFVKYIREEKKFTSLEELVVQINKDIKEVGALISQK